MIDSRNTFLNSFYITSCLTFVCVVAQEWLNVTSNYTALMSDLNIDLLEPGIAVQLYEAKNDNFTLMGTIPVDGNWQNITIHCGVITKGGHYLIQLISNDTTEDDDIIQDGQTVELDVRWPEASLSFEPKRITTYPDPWQQVVIVMKFEGHQCEPAVGSAVPMLWLDLMYCGLSANACKNVSRELSHGSMEHLIVHSEQIRGYPRFRKIFLKCDVFGIAGFYTAVLRPPERQAAFTHVMDGQLEVVPSNKFTLNVHGKSIFPCDNYGGGVPVMFQYPSCILPTSDKIRLFGRQREDVSTLLPPTKLHYISEHRIVKGRHNVYFDCDLFSEKYIEYCFVYVNQAVNRAYTNIKTNCVPTLPITEDDSGQWSKWSEWSPCSTTCYGGTRNRYRTCDSPPPKYGAKFCQGSSLQTEPCGEKKMSGNECGKIEQQIQKYNNTSTTGFLPTYVSDELGAECRCGCVIHMSKATRTLSATTKGCPGRSFWLIKADDKTTIQFDFIRLFLSCSNQWIKLRDGDSTASNLLAHLEGTPDSTNPIMSTGSYLLVEFFSSSTMLSNGDCFGGFFAQINRISANNWSLPNSSHVEFNNNLIYLISDIDSFLATISAILLFLLITCMCFSVQFAERKHKYHKAITTMDKHSNMGSTCSMLNDNDYTASTTTLQSHLPPTIDILDTDENRDNVVEGETNSVTGSEIVPENIVTHSSTIDQCTPFVSQTSLTSRKIITQSTSTLNDRPKSQRHNPLTSSTDSSIHGHDVSDLEMDYYDYNVQNTNSVPGSYIGMDPAYCLWIPPLSDQSPGDHHETMEMSILDIKNDKCKKNCEISSKYNNRLSADSESTLVSEDCVSLKTLKSSPKAYFSKNNQKAELINDSSIKFVDEDDGVDVKDIYVDNKAAYMH
ncbi:hypothetical protein QTP88_002735 [Uroleucon formosanum]